MNYTLYYVLYIVYEIETIYYACLYDILLRNKINIRNKTQIQYVLIIKDMLG